MNQMAEETSECWQCGATKYLSQLYCANTGDPIASTGANCFCINSRRDGECPSYCEDCFEIEEPRRNPNYDLSNVPSRILLNLIMGDEDPQKKGIYEWHLLGFYAEVTDLPDESHSIVGGLHFNAYSKDANDNPPQWLVKAAFSIGEKFTTEPEYHRIKEVIIRTSAGWPIGIPDKTIRIFKRQRNLRRNSSEIPVPPTIQAICEKCKKKMVAGTTNDGLTLLCIKCGISISLVALRSSEEY